MLCKSYLCSLLIMAAMLIQPELSAQSRSSIIPGNLVCEYSDSAVIDIQNPRLSWINANPEGIRGAAQTAYRIRVSLSPDSFRKPVWDSGKVIYDDSAFITYEGQELRSRTTYWWQVKVWDEDGRASQWSEPACWHVGVLTQDEWKGDIRNFRWTREPASCTASNETIEIVTNPHTDLWQRTYYHFRNDNAPVFQMETEEKFFSFTVKTSFEESHHRFDQCGIVMYLDSDNWLKGSVEYENERFQHLGSVATNNGYSDWATTAIDANIKSMWYRFSRREDDYCIECSTDGENFSQMRVCHMWQGGGKIRFGVYACSPEDSSFKAVFTNMELTECKWLAHDGQQPDEE